MEKLTRYERKFEDSLEFKNIKESSKIDISYIYKRLKDFQKGIENEEGLIDGILIDIGRRHDKKLGIRILDHIEISMYPGFLKDSELKSLAVEIYYNYETF